MPKVIQRIESHETAEVEVIYDDGSRVVYAHVDGSYSLFRFPAQTDIVEAANGNAEAIARIAAMTARIRYTPRPSEPNRELAPEVADD